MLVVVPILRPERFNNGQQRKSLLTLPKDLYTAIKGLLATMPAARWVPEAQALSQRYRGDRADTKRLAFGEAQVLGYLALILPATYAQLCGAIKAIAARVPGWQPRTLLDLGSGPGTALWAAAAHWPSLEQMTAWEREPAFIATGKQLARNSENPAIAQAVWEQRDLSQIRSIGQYDLVVLGHVLNELDQPTQVDVVQAAWNMTAGVLLIVEPGTSAAFPVVRAARDMLLPQGARTLAPCAHDRPCPLEHDWCHFPQRIARPDFQRKARGALSDWEDSKFSYAALARFPAEHAIWGRVIREVESNKAYAVAKISSTEGIVLDRALKRHREEFRRVKGLEWGDVVEGKTARQEDSETGRQEEM